MHPQDIASPELVELLRRSIVMLPPGAPALRREDALVVLEVLERALRGGGRQG